MINTPKTELTRDAMNLLVTEISNGVLSDSQTDCESKSDSE